MFVCWFARSFACLGSWLACSLAWFAAGVVWLVGRLVVWLVCRFGLRRFVSLFACSCLARFDGRSYVRPSACLCVFPLFCSLGLSLGVGLHAACRCRAAWPCQASCGKDYSKCPEAHLQQPHAVMYIERGCTSCTMSSGLAWGWQALCGAWWLRRRLQPSYGFSVVHS